MKLTVEQRKEMIDRLVKRHIESFEDCPRNFLMEDLIEYLADGNKGWNQMTDEELQAEYDGVFEDDQEEDDDLS